LNNRYGFDTLIVSNPSAAQVDQVLKDYTKRFEHNLNGQYPANGQLFIFFSGHGTEQHGNGYFLPSDADQNDLRITGLEYSYLRNLINSINCQHILVAVDACYSAYFDENFKKRSDFQFNRPGERVENEKILANHEAFKARVFFTSDAVGEMTPDKSGFAKKLLEGLRTFNLLSGFMTSSELFASYVQKASPTPNGGEFGDDEAASSYLFFSTVPILPIDPTTDKRAWDEAKTTNTLEAYWAYLRNLPQGQYRRLAQDRINSIEKDLIEWKKATEKNTVKAYLYYVERSSEKYYLDLANKEIDNLLMEKYGLWPVSGGTFSMGISTSSKDERPQHPVELNNFFISKTWVSVAAFHRFVQEKNYLTEAEKNGGTYEKGLNGWIKRPNVDWRYDAEGNKLPLVALTPVVHLSWNDAMAYCNWISEETGLKFRLPTEAEWEYLAQTEKYAQQLKIKPEHTFFEWCLDWYDENYYSKSEKNNPQGPLAGRFRVIRGCENDAVSWKYDRQFIKPDHRQAVLGFRVVVQR
jgi:formylglycine-generating enzyme required for sulfatase activity